MTRTSLVQDRLMFSLTRFLVRLLVRLSVRYVLWTCDRVDSALGTRTAVLARVAVQVWVTLGSPPFLLMLGKGTGPGTPFCT